MRPFYIIRFLYGLDAGELAYDYVDYTDMVTNWNTNIAPVPPTLLVYTDAENKLLNMEQMKSDSIDYYGSKQGNLIGASGIQYGLNISNAIDFFLNFYIFNLFNLNIQSLSEVQEERILELLTLKQETNVTNINNIDVPSLTGGQITNLLDDYNVSEYIEILQYGWYWLTLVLGISDTDAKTICIETYNFVFTETLSTFYLTNDIDNLIQNNSTDKFWAYDFQNNVTYDNNQTQMPINAAKTYAASWYTPSSMALISGGGFDVPEDGIYKIEFNLNIEEGVVVYEGRKTYVELDINGVKHMVSSDHYLIYETDVITIQTSETLPLENGDNIKLFLHGDSGIGNTLNLVSGSITITKEK